MVKRGEEATKVKTKSIGGFLRYFQHERDLTNREIADLVGVTEGMISHVRCNRYEAPLGFIRLLKPHLTPFEDKYLLECFIEHMKDALDGTYNEVKRTKKAMEQNAKRQATFKAKAKKK